jgi:hypothetical protein
MHMVWEKARREMRPGSQLISNSFPIESVTPTEQIEAGGRVLFVYDPGGKTAE